MSYFIRIIRKKALPENPVSLLVILGLIILIFIVSMVSVGFLGESFLPVSIVLATTEVSTTSDRHSAEILAGSVVLVDVVEKDVQLKTAVVSKTIQRTAEAHLKIPRIGIDAVIKEMGVTSGGAMAVPGNRTEVGWFSLLGAHPGEMGSAVIGGHKRWDSRTGVFANLDQLAKGDVLSVVDAEGVSTAFIVRNIRSYNATDTDTGIFESGHGNHLNLITCSGVWNPVTKSYSQRLVVFTDAVSLANEIALLDQNSE